MTAQLFAAFGAVLSAVFVGALGYIVHLAKKAGQKQTEAEVEQQRATDAKAAGEAIAAHVEPSDVVGKLRDGNF